MVVFQWIIEENLRALPLTILLITHQMMKVVRPSLQKHVHVIYRFLINYNRRNLFIFLLNILVILVNSTIQCKNILSYCTLICVYYMYYCYKKKYIFLFSASSDSFGNAGKTLRNLLERQRKKIQKSQYQQYN